MGVHRTFIFLVSSVKPFSLKSIITTFLGLNSNKQSRNDIICTSTSKNKYEHQTQKFLFKSFLLSLKSVQKTSMLRFYNVITDKFINIILNHFINSYPSVKFLHNSDQFAHCSDHYIPVKLIRFRIIYMYSGNRLFYILSF